MNIDDLYRLLRLGHVQAQGIVDTVADPMVVLDGALVVQSASRAFFETFHVDRFETVGRPLYELGDGQWDIPELRRLLTEVIPKSSALVDYRVEHEFPGVGRRVMLLTARTLRHPENSRLTLLLSMVDATEQFKREATNDLLFGELRHRVKNLFGLAQSIARHASTEGRTAEQFRDEFLGRFGAMIDAHDIAFGSNGETALKRLVERTLAPYSSEERVIITPETDFDLGPSTLMSLSLVLHELATNASKYGALSTDHGQISVRWEVDQPSQAFVLHWVESGGPPAVPPTRTGYGSKLIDTTISYSLGGEVEQTYDSSGLAVRISLPLPASEWI